MAYFACQDPRSDCGLEKFRNFRETGPCLHGSGGPQVGEITSLGGVTRLSKYSSREIIWTGGLPHLSGFPNPNPKPPGVPHLHVNRP